MTEGTPVNKTSPAFFGFCRWFAVLCHCRLALIGMTGAAVFSTTLSAADESTLQYPVQRFVVLYGRPHPQSPPLDNLQNLAIDLTRNGNLLTAGGAGTVESVHLNDPQPAGTIVTEAGLKTILTAVVTRVNAGGIYGVVAFPSREQIDPITHEDLRPATDRSLNIIVWLSEVAAIRTIGRGQRVGADDSVNNPIHARIVSHSPLEPPHEGEPGSLIEKLKLDDYLRRLNRHPGRTVEAALSSSDQPGRVVLDYLVNENRPWFAYGQLSNTGTPATSDWRERVGYRNDQLTNRDDVLTVDFITSGLDEANAAFGSYEIPVRFPDKLWAKVYGSWGDFDASVLLNSGIGAGTSGVEQFTGEDWTAGTEWTASLFTLMGTPIDVAAGLNYHHHQVTNKSAAISGQAGFLSPMLSVRAERASAAWTMVGRLGYETNFTNHTAAELAPLGRLDTTDSYNLVRGEVSTSVFLEPLFFGIPGSQDWRRATLAHELSFSLHGQYVLGGDRVIPQLEQSVGGMFSVRGYQESVVAGDDTVVANLEYRFHLPRVLRPSSVARDGERTMVPEAAPTLFGRPFNLRPPRIYARPDWDLIFRAFFDYGGTQINRGTHANQRLEDHNFTLMSTGVGVELQLRQSLNIRLDYGYVLKGLQTGVRATTFTPYIPGPNDTDSGESRVHVLATFVW